MTLLDLLYALRAFCEEATKKLKLPEAVQKGDTKTVERAPKGYIQRLPDQNAPQKFAPYFIVQAAVGHHVQEEGKDYMLHLQQERRRGRDFAVKPYGDN